MKKVIIVFFTIPIYLWANQLQWDCTDKVFNLNYKFEQASQLQNPKKIDKLQDLLNTVYEVSGECKSTDVNKDFDLDGGNFFGTDNLKIMIKKTIKGEDSSANKMLENLASKEGPSMMIEGKFISSNTYDNRKWGTFEINGAKTNLLLLLDSPERLKNHRNEVLSLKYDPENGVLYDFYVKGTNSVLPTIAEEGETVNDRNLKKKSSIKTFIFDGIHQIKGFISVVHHYGPPGYGENPNEDKQLTSYILKLEKPIIVVETDKNALNYTTQTTEIQLVTSKFQEKLKVAFRKNKKVMLTGEFFSSHTGYHIRKLLLDVKSLTDIKSSKNTISPQSNTYSLKNLRKGMNYSKAREIILNSGLQSNNTRWQDIPKYGQVNDVYYNNGWNEVVSCAGTGTAPCRFEFKDIHQKTLVVITEGECLNSNNEPPKKGEKCELSVSSWFFEQSKVIDNNSYKTIASVNTQSSTNNLFKRYQKACNEGCKPSCTNLASGYRHGMGNKEDYIKAQKLYKKACDDGNAKGCFSLGNVYNHGIGMDFMTKLLNQNKSIKLYKKACHGGYMAGCYAIAFYYMHRGKDKIKGLKFHEKACNGGYRDSCNRLAVMHDHGYTPVRQDGFKAKELFRRASELVMPCADTNEINFARTKR